VTEAVRRFVILSARRSGSNLLCTLIDSHPDALCHHELFNPSGIFTALDLRDTATPLHDIAARERDPIAYLAQVWRYARGHACIGFKMTPDQHPQILQAVLEDIGIAKIVLRRDNPLRALVSERIAEITGRWEAYAGEGGGQETNPGERPPIHVERDELDEHVRQVQTFYDGLTDAMQRSGQRWLELRYESLFDADEQHRLCDFLGLSTRPLQARSIRQNPEPLERLLDNADALRLSLASTPLARLLD
jgi:LPS sulfotransferase NodH